MLSQRYNSILFFSFLCHFCIFDSFKIQLKKILCFLSFKHFFWIIESSWISVYFRLKTKTIRNNNNKSNNGKTTNEINCYYCKHTMIASDSLNFTKPHANSLRKYDAIISNMLRCSSIVIHFAIVRWCNSR